MKKSFLFSVLFLAFVVFQSPVSKAQTGKSDALETLGSITGMLMYNTYVGIGSIGDGYEEGVYDAKYVGDVMDEQVSGIKAVNAQLLVLLNSGFLDDEADLSFMRDVRTTFDLLINEAEKLKEYAASTDQGDADKFQSYRKQAWSKISDLLGLGDEE